MKQLFALFLMILSILLLFSSCSPEYETITRNSGNYLYQLGEAIEILDIETGECIATLKITEFKLAKSTPFLVSEYAGLDDNYEEIYEDVTYRQLTRVSYEFQNEPGYDADISAENFDVLDDGEIGNVIDPKLTDASLPEEAGSFWIASKQSTDTVELTFTYDRWQSRHTARIWLNLSEQKLQNESDNDGSDDSALTTDREEELWTIIFVLMGIIFLLGCAVVVLSILLATRRR